MPVSPLFSTARGVYITKVATLAEINALAPADFVARLGDIFEHSPWVAEMVEASRPFAHVGALHTTMVQAVASAGDERQTALLKAHPELAGREARAGAMTSSSVSEQASAGLQSLSAQELARMGALNALYRETFGFPFIIAVRGLDKAAVFAALERRVTNDRETELKTALEEVYKITRMRLDRLIVTDTPT